MPSVKAVKGGKTESEFEERHITLRGVAYTVRELSVPEYKECLKAAEDEDGNVPFQNLLDQMVVKAISPSPLTRATPMPYPVYRTLEDMVNVMHFITLKDEAQKEPEPEPDEDEADKEPDEDPNP